MAALGAMFETSGLTSVNIGFAVLLDGPAAGW